jgi:hypothetical protein
MYIETTTPTMLREAKLFRLDRLAPIGQCSATCPLGGAVLRSRAQSTLSEGLPDIALVRAARKRRVSVKNGIASLDKVGTAWLPIDDCQFNAKRLMVQAGILTAPWRQ